MVVDDNVDAATLLAATLRVLQYDVRVAHDGPAALQTLKEFAPEMALLDIGLPVMDGFELASRIRQELRADRLILIAVSGYGTLPDRDAFSRAGFQDYLVKPVAVETLQRTLKKYETFHQGAIA